MVVREPSLPHALAVIKMVNNDATRWLLDKKGRRFQVDILVFESEEELWTAAGVGARTADLSDCCVREVRRAAITPADRHLLSKGVADRAWRRRPHSIAHQGRQWRRPVTGWAEEQGCALADGGDAVSGGAL